MDYGTIIAQSIWSRKYFKKNINQGWFVYIVLCSKDNTLYTGITNNLTRRLDQHNKGIKAGGAKYTSGRGPVVLVKVFIRYTKSEALKLEYKIKKLSREEKLNFIDTES